MSWSANLRGKNREAAKQAVAEFRATPYGAHMPESVAGVIDAAIDATPDVPEGMELCVNTAGHVDPSSVPPSYSTSLTIYFGVAASDAGTEEAKPEAEAQQS